MMAIFSREAWVRVRVRVRGGSGLGPEVGLDQLSQASEGMVAPVVAAWRLGPDALQGFRD